MAKTGEKCALDGWYNGVCELEKHADSARFTLGDVFTPCATCGGQHKAGGVVVNWVWSRSARAR